MNSNSNGNKLLILILLITQLPVFVTIIVQRALSSVTYWPLSLVLSIVKLALCSLQSILAILFILLLSVFTREVIIKVLLVPFSKVPIFQIPVALSYVVPSAGVQLINSNPDGNKSVKTTPVAVVALFAL